MPFKFRPDAQESAAARPDVRFDVETQQRIIARALHLQRQHERTASAAELEAVAAEVGLEPAFVREAIAQVRGTRPGTGFWSRNVTPWSMRDAAALGGTMALAALSSGTGDAGFGFVLVFLLGLFLGPKRRVALAGAATIAVATVTAPHVQLHPGTFNGFVLTLCGFGGALSTLGAAARCLIGTRLPRRID